MKFATIWWIGVTCSRLLAHFDWGVCIHTYFAIKPHERYSLPREINLRTRNYRLKDYNNIVKFTYTWWLIRSSKTMRGSRGNMCSLACSVPAWEFLKSSHWNNNYWFPHLSGAVTLTAGYIYYKSNFTSVSRSKQRKLIALTQQQKMACVNELATVADWLAQDFYAGNDDDLDAKEPVLQRRGIATSCQGHHFGFGLGTWIWPWFGSAWTFWTFKLKHIG